ncbi:hypothetical protein PRIEUP_LOCUS16309 [Pristimantis euphronides]
MCGSTALSDPSWLLVQLEGQSYVYGAAYILHQGFNLTEPGVHQLLHKSGLRLLALLTACCYIAVVLGLAALLLDFLGTKYMGIKRMMGVLLPPFLHLATALLSAAAVTLCTYLYIVLHQELYFKIIKPPTNTLSLGESYYFAIGACVASILAAVFSFSYARQYKRENGIFSSSVPETSPLLEEAETPDPPGEYG